MKRTQRTTKHKPAGPTPGQLLTTTEAEHQVEGGLLLDVVVSKGSAILQLLASEDETLLVRRNALLVLDLGLDIVDGVAALDLEGDGLPGQGLDEDLHLAGTTNRALALAREVGFACFGGRDGNEEWQ